MKFQKANPSNPPPTSHTFNKCNKVSVNNKNNNSTYEITHNVLCA